MASPAARRVAVADEHRPRRRNRLEAAGGVDEIAGDHAHAAGPDRDDRLAGLDSRPQTPGRRYPRAAPIRRTASTRSSAARTARSASSSWAIGVPHTAMTASPMNFSTVPPYRSTIARHSVEVRRQELAHVLGVACLGERREPDEVGEEHADQAPLGAGAVVRGRLGAVPVASAGRWLAALAAELGAGRVGRPARAQAALRRCPHSRQNFRPTSFWAPQVAQITRVSSLLGPRKRQYRGGSLGLTT